VTVQYRDWSFNYRNIKVIKNNAIIISSVLKTLIHAIDRPESGPEMNNALGLKPLKAIINFAVQKIFPSSSALTSY
jgi:hypothetical protein